MNKLTTTILGSLFGWLLAVIICTLEHMEPQLPVVTTLYMILYGLLGYFVPYIVSIVLDCVNVVRKEQDKDDQLRSLHGDYYDAIKEEQDKKDK